MNKRERVDAALRGQPVDRVPISFWGDDYLREWSAKGLGRVARELRLGLRQQLRPSQAEACVSP